MIMAKKARSGDKGILQPPKTEPSLAEESMRKQAQEQLQEREETYRALIEQASDSIALVDSRSGRFVEFNLAAHRDLGYTREEFEKLTVADIDARISPENFKDHLAATFQKGSDVFESRHRHKSGQLLDARVSVKSLHLRGREYFAAIWSDITERKQAEQALVERESRLRALFDNAGYSISVAKKGVQILGNPAFVALFGYKDAAELVGKPVIENIAPEERDSIRKSMEDRLRGVGVPAHYETKGLRRDGTIFDVDVMVSTYVFNDEVYTVGFQRDITDRKLAEKALRESEARLRAILDATPFPVVFVDVQDNNIDFYSRSAITLFGHAAQNATEWYELAYPDPDYRREVIERWKPFLEKARQSGQVIDAGLYRITCSNGSVRLCELYAAFVADRLVITFDDVTERKRAEEEKLKLETQLQHAQKLESLGVLAGGIAHDFNNILQGILGNATLVLMDLAEPSPARVCVEDILKASRRAADLTRQMLAYSGKGHFMIQQVDLGALVSEMAHLIAVSISKKTILNLNLTPVLITADVAQIQQVVMNLILNAAEALDQESGGEVTLATGVQTCTRDYLRHSLLPEKPPPGAYGYIEVSDTGCGMDEAILKKLFDPFFTTKSTGRGLGMSAALGIVRGHKGGIMVDSAPGKGTTIRVLFPLSDEPAAQGPSHTKSGAAWKGTGTVLFVDDEEGVRRLGKSMLELLGFRVLVAADGREALEIYQRFSNEIVCVVLDLNMPHMNGEQTLKQLRLSRHDVPVVLSSGFSEIQLKAGVAGQQVSAFIKKPYDFQSLSDVLQSILS